MTTEQTVPANGHARTGPEPRRGWRRRPAATAPVARFEPGRVATTPHRNPGWVAGGILLVLLSALGGVLLFTSRDDRREALVAVRDLAAGEQIQRDDLRVERVAVDGALDTVAPSALDGLVGQRVVGPIPRGTLLHPGMFSPDDALGPDEMDIGAALDAGEFPQSDIPLGSAVELLVVGAAEATPNASGPASDVSDPASTPAARTRSIGTAMVTAVEERATGQLLVTLRVQRDVGLVAAQANRDDMLRIALIGPPS